MTIDDTALAISLAGLDHVTAAGSDLHGALRQVVAVTSLMFATDGAGIMLIDDSQALHHVLILIGAALLARDRDALTTQRQEALEHSVVIERAVGLLTGARRVDAVTALDILRRQARADRRKVADPATDTLEALR